MTPEQHGGLLYALFGAAALGAVVFTAWFRNARGRRNAEAAVERLARELGLTVIPADVFGVGLTASGTVDGVRVELERKGATLLVELSSKAIPDDVGVHRQTSSDREMGVEVSMAIGDPMMTSHTINPSMPGMIATIARLDDTTRRWLENREAMISSQQLVFQVRIDDPDAVERIREGVERVIALGALQTPAALLRNVENDPLMSVRNKNEELLLDHFPHTAEAAKRFALRISSPDATPQQRLAARILLPSERQLTFTKQDFAQGDLVELLRGPLQRPILDVMTPFTARLEPLLLAILPSVPKEAATSIIHALGAHGSAACVEPLLPYTRSLLGGELDRAATDAVAQIQARLKGAGAGQLTMSEDPAAAGALSVSTQQPGAVSLAKKQPT